MESVRTPCLLSSRGSVRTAGEQLANGFAGAHHKVQDPEYGDVEEGRYGREDEYDAAEAGVPQKGGEGGGMRVTFQV